MCTCVCTCVSGLPQRCLCTCVCVCASVSLREWMPAPTHTQTHKPTRTGLRVRVRLNQREVDVRKFLLQLRHASPVVAWISSKPGAHVRANARAHPYVCVCAETHVHVSDTHHCKRYRWLGAEQEVVARRVMSRCNACADCVRLHAHVCAHTHSCMCVWRESTALAEAHKLKRAPMLHVPRPLCSPPHCRCAAVL